MRADSSRATALCGELANPSHAPEVEFCSADDRRCTHMQTQAGRSDRSGAPRLLH